jgi:hypothetical protein
MFGGLNRLLVAAAVTGAAFAVVLAGPSAALAGCSGGTSAVNVYKECQPSGGSGSAQSGSGSHHSGSSSTPVTISAPAARAIKHAGKDSRALASVMRTGPEGLLHSDPSSGVPKPSAVGSVFDLGSGPTALLIALAGTAVLLLGGSGLRVWHHRRS